MPALLNTFLFIEPKQHYLNYASMVLHQIIEANKQSGQMITELVGDDANPDRIKQELSKSSPMVFCGSGHGSPEIFTVECTTPLLHARNSEELALMKERVILLTSCLPPESMITCNPSIKPISECTNNDKVLTHKGRFRNITTIFRRPYEGDLIVIKPRKLLFSTKLTPTHPVLAIKAIKCGKSSGFCLPFRKLKRCQEGKCKKNMVVVSCKRCHNEWIGSANATHRRCWKCGNKTVDIIRKVTQPWESYKFEWVEAKNLSKDDLIVYPIIHDTFDVPKIYLTDYWDPTIVKKHKSITDEVIAEIDGRVLSYSQIGQICKNKGRCEGLAYHVQKRLKGKIKTSRVASWLLNDKKIINKSKKLEINNEIQLTNEFMELCGLYVAEGHTDNGTIQLSLGITEIDLAKKAVDLFNFVFGLKATVICCPKNSARLVRAYCDPLAQFFRANFGLNALTKRVPNWFLTLPIEKQIPFLHLYSEGDGYSTDNGTVKYMNTASKTLAFQLLQILLRLGYVPMVRFDKNYKSTSGIYELQYSEIPRIGLIKDNYVLLPISNIKKEFYKGDVFNLEVEDDNSYVTQSMVVHNCLTAQQLGPALIGAGAVAYAGYKEEFWFYTGDVAGTTRAVQSPFLAEFAFVASILQGKRTGEAREDQLKRYDEEIAYWTTGDGKDNADALELARILEINKGISVFLGESAVSPSPQAGALGTQINPAITFTVAFAVLGYAIYKTVLA